MRVGGTPKGGQTKPPGESFSATRQHQWFSQARAALEVLSKQQTTLWNAEIRN